MTKQNHLSWNIQFFAESETDQDSTDQGSTDQGSTDQGSPVQNTSDLDALTKVIKELTGQNKELVKELSEVKASNLRLAAQMPGNDSSPKDFDTIFRGIFDYGQNGGINGSTGK